MSIARPPSGFTTLDRASGLLNESYDVIGVCVDYFEPAKSRGTDYTMQFVLRDPSWYRDRGLTFRFFNSSIDKLPCIQANGDVLILRNVKTKSYNGQAISMSNHTTSWVVVSGSTVLESTCPDGSDIIFKTSGVGLGGAPVPTVQELRYIKQIVRSEDPMNYRPPPKATALQIESIMKDAGGTPPQRKDKWRPIGELRMPANAGNWNFADLFGEVRKLWYSDNGRVEISLTDYTTNKLLYSYSEEVQAQDGDTYGYTRAPHERWPGPWGRMTIGVTLHDAHAGFARSQVKPGMYVLIKNCHIKLDPNNSRLEAACRGDRDNLSKVNIAIIQPHRAETDQRFKDLLKRRLEYEKVARTKGLRFGFNHELQQEGKKRAADDGNNENPDLDGTKGLSKTNKRKRRKNNKQVAQTTENDSEGMSVQPNQNVRCNNIDVPPKSIDDILDPTILQRTTTKGTPFTLPFQNCSYKCKIRVVDYWPNALEDFSVPYLLSEHVPTPTTTPSQDTDLALSAAATNPHTVRWEWRFFLIVEDAGPRPPDPTFQHQQMALLVADQDGDYLLRDEATDLRAHPQELAKLREKLFVLWGNLQERKEEPVDKLGGVANVKVQSKPFECFVKEYGVPIPSSEDGDGSDGGADTTYQRMFRLFGTST